MGEKTGTETGSSRPSALVLVTDPSVEGATLVHALRARGFRVLDVPVALLAGALAADRAAAVVVDVDQPGAAQTVLLALARPESGSPRLVAIGRDESARALGELFDAAALFPRPIDVEAIARRVAEIEPSEHRYPLRGTTPPPSVAPRRETFRPEDDGGPSDFPRALDLEAPSLLGQPEDDAGLVFEHEDIWISPDLEAVLERAAERARAALAAVPSSAEPRAAVVLADHHLELLDEPLDGDDEEARPLHTATGPQSLPPLRSDRPAHVAAETLRGETLPPVPSEAQQSPTGPPGADEEPPPLTPPSISTQRWDIPSVVDVRAEERRRPSAFPAPSLTKPDAREDFTPSRAEPVRGPPPRRRGDDAQVLPEVFADGDAARVVAQAIASRLSGCLTLETADGVRRVVLHEGDVVTAVSEMEAEAIVPFLAGRGDIPRALVGALDRRIPPFGRLAGAALIAQGHLGQDDLWAVLRTHAEWVLGCILRGGGGALRHERDAPGRLAAEPAVFGGAAGSEVFLEAVRRSIDAERALAWLGGPGARVARGPRAALLVECALAPDEAELADQANGGKLSELAPGQETEVAPLVYGLACLGVLEVLAPARAEPRAPSERDPLDDEAIRRRVEARLALALDGDYFAVLGVARDATPYEIKKRYLELRRGFEPSRLLTAGTADLGEDVKLVLEVIDEAYEVLREPHRRDRYRRALDAGPPG